MQRPGAEHPDTAVELITQAVLPGRHGQQGGQQHAGRNRCALEIGHLGGPCRQGFSRDVVPCQPAHAATDEVDQRDPVPAAAQARGKRQGRRRHTKGNDVRQRIELPPQRRMLAAPARHASVEHVKNEGCRCHRRRCIKPGLGPLHRVQHGQENTRDPAGRITQREEVREVELPQHGEMSGLVSQGRLLSSVVMSVRPAMPYFTYFCGTGTGTSSTGALVCGSMRTDVAPAGTTTVSTSRITPPPATLPLALP